MDYAKQYQEYLARANQALEKACEIFLPEESEVCRAVVLLPVPLRRPRPPSRPDL